VVVTDEIENLKYQDKYYFSDLYLKYYQEVYPAKLVFVSFLANPSSKGRMVKSLENLGIEVLLFRLDGNRPDLTKLDTLLGILSSESSFFPKFALDFSNIYVDSGINSLIERIRNPPERPQIEHVKPIKIIEKIDDMNDDEPIRKLERKRQNDEEIPNHFCCPITLEIMKEPVIAPSGYTYERSAIEEHLRKNRTDPFTMEEMTLEDLRPNRALKDAILSFLNDKNQNNN